MAKRQWNCDCGFTVTTPGGDDELTGIANLHVQKSHNSSIAPEDVLKMTKQVE